MFLQCRRWNSTANGLKTGAAEMWSSEIFLRGNTVVGGLIQLSQWLDNLPRRFATPAVPERSLVPRRGHMYIFGVAFHTNKGRNELIVN